MIVDVESIKKRSILEWDSKLIAHHLCIIDVDNLNKISPLDVYGAKWTKQV
jgi:hypothetical protein